MLQVKIDTRFRMPERNPKGGRPVKYPWKRLKVGESFLIETKKLENARGIAYKAQKRYGIKVTTKALNHGVRVWRVE